MPQLTERVTRRIPGDAGERRRRQAVVIPGRDLPTGSMAASLGRLLEEVKRGDSDWTLPILLGAVIVFVATVLAVVLTIVELAALLA